MSAQPELNGPAGDGEVARRTRVRRLAVEGALAFTPTVYRDHRGMFVSPYEWEPFAAAAGAALFPLAQASFSESRRGVVRGVHFTTTPPGAAKYVWCARGSALDIVVDTRVGSPTFGRWDSVLLDQRTYRAVYLPVGVGHAFVALEDQTVMSYLLSQGYAQEHERAINPLDPSLALPVPRDPAPILSERDRTAPTLAEARAAGILPQLAACHRAAVALSRAAGGAGPTARRP